MKNQTFTASIWREDDWFIAQCLEVDIASQGQSEEEALDNLAKALELYFEPPQPSLKSVNMTYTRFSFVAQTVSLCQESVRLFSIRLAGICYAQNRVSPIFVRESVYAVCC